MKSSWTVALCLSVSLGSCLVGNESNKAKKFDPQKLLSPTPPIYGVLELADYNSVNIVKVAIALTFKAGRTAKQAVPDTLKLAQIDKDGNPDPDPDVLRGIDVLGVNGKLKGNIRTTHIEMDGLSDIEYRVVNITLRELLGNSHADRWSKLDFFDITEETGSDMQFKYDRFAKIGSFTPIKHGKNEDEFNSNVNKFKEKYFPTSASKK